MRRKRSDALALAWYALIAHASLEVRLSRVHRSFNVAIQMDAAQCSANSTSGKLRALIGAAALALMLTSALAMLAAYPEPAFAKQTAHKIVMIGDSYALNLDKYDVTRAWPERVRGLLGIPPHNCMIYRHSGYGFARTNKKFLSLIKRAKRDRSVTDVLIVGGAGNDRWSSDAKVKVCYAKTIKRLKYLYPNATIMHTITSWHMTNQKYMRTITKRYTLYSSLAKKYGVMYLPSCQSVLYNKPSYYAVDNHHANDVGQRAMARTIAKEIRKHNKHYRKAKTSSASVRSVGKLAVANAL